MATAGGRFSRIAALAATLAVTACGGGSADMATFDWGDAHKVTVTAKPAVLVLDATAGEDLLPKDMGRISRFSQDYLNRGEGGVRVSVAASGRDDRQALQLAKAIARALMANGLREGDLAVYLVGRDAGLPLGTAALTYTQYVVDVPECNAGVGNGTMFNPDNANPANFGCAVQRNRSLMIANPRDLVQPQPLGGRDATRANGVFGKYRAGDETKAKGDVRDLLYNVTDF